MISTPPSERRPPQPSSNLPPHGVYRLQTVDGRYSQSQGYHEGRFYGEDSSSPNTPRNPEDYNSGSTIPAANAAAALAQLHNHKVESDWESDAVRKFEGVSLNLQIANLSLGLGF